MTSSSRERAGRGGKKPAAAPRMGISSSSPLGVVALYLLTQWRKSSGGLVFLAEDGSRAERLGAVVHALDSACNVLVFPRLNTLPFDPLEPSREIAGRRSSVLRRLAVRDQPVLLITTAEAAMERLPPRASWARTEIRLKIGSPFDEGALRARLEALGYDLDEDPDYPGGVLFHGKTFEIFPAGALGPLRIEHAEGKILRITAFNPVDQDIVSELSSVFLDAMSERLVLGPRRKDVTLGDYCTGARWIADAAVPGRGESWLTTIEEAAERAEGDRRYLSRRDWKAMMKQVRVLPRQAPYQRTPDFSRDRSPRKALRDFLEAQPARSRVLLVAATDQDLRAMMQRAGIRVERCSDWAAAVSAKERGAALLADFDRGFIVPAKRPLVIITASDVLGSKAQHPQPMARAWASPLDSDDVPEFGSVVVHLQRGLARLDGLHSLSAPGVPSREMIRLVFAGDDAVLLPVAELALIWPYASDPGDLPLDKADGNAWRARRAAAETEINVTAKQLARQIDQRRRRRAPKLVPPGPDYEKFVGRFPYFATPDQADAIRDVLEDLAAGHPMDRIICGDVGFGKTEVALRATAAAVFSGKQVAIAVPTTVLARQHVTTFTKRFEPFGIEVANLSRIASAAELKRTKDRLRRGDLKIVIGTQALGSKDVRFADLGLVIVDEEQHFGVAEKAKFSALAKSAHLLWMSATPIPRTLAAGLAGLRDLSVIASPPVHRAPVVTRIAPLSDAAIAAPLLREQRRRGQSFLICPRIRDLDPMLDKLRSIAPELRAICIHGRLGADEIDDRMMSFVEGGADVLVATNIVESGLDIPRANTIVVCWPEQFGLAQLHQLRGRVGRAGTRAFAHFLTEADSERSEKRLAVIEELSKPGAGFAISARDLDLRGAGDLLSERQSGHVQVFGPALYGHLLRLALAKNGKEMSDLWTPELNLPLSELLPSSYVQSDAIRLEIYTRAARCRTGEELAELQDEALRRFGELPPEARDFFELAALRIECRRRGIIKLDVGPEAIAATLLARRFPKVKSGLLHRDGDRVIYQAKRNAPALARVQEFIEILDM